MLTAAIASHANGYVSSDDPNGGDQVMCLTCHRAHASPIADAGRRDFTAIRRSFGNKCHAKDYDDAPCIP